MTTEITSIPGQTDNTKDSLVKDLKGIAGKADQLVKEAGQTVAAELSARRHAISEKACEAANVTHEYVRANPWKVVGAAAALGAFIGVMVSRR